ncbi:N4-gp56 family major capsid protein [Porticoccus sp.]
MADVFTSTTQLTNQVLTSYDRNAYFALRDMAIWDQFADVKPGNITSPGSSVRFNIWSDLSEATTALSETVDVDAVGLSDSTVTVTPSEYGNAVLITLKLRSDDFLIGFDPDVANILAENMVKSIDTIARTAIDSAGTAVWASGTADGDLASTDNITAALVKQQRAALKKANVSPKIGNLYAAVIHPDVAYDLKVETGDGAWIMPHQYVDTQALYVDEIGTFGGFKFVESNRTDLDEDAGTAGTESVYSTYFFGQQAIAKAESIAPSMVMGPVTDHLNRFRPLGWYAYLGYGEFRSASLRRLRATSSIGTNT